LTITLIQKERSKTNELKVICVDNHTQKNLQRAVNLSVTVKNVEVSLLHMISIALYLTATWKKEKKHVRILNNIRS